MFHFPWALRQCGVDALQYLFCRPALLEFSPTAILDHLPCPCVPYAFIYAVFCPLLSLLVSSGVSAAGKNFPRIYSMGFSVFDFPVSVSLHVPVSYAVSTLPPFVLYYNPYSDAAIKFQ